MGNTDNQLAFEFLLPNNTFFEISPLYVYLFNKHTNVCKPEQHKNTASRNEIYNLYFPHTTVVLLIFALSKFRGKPTIDHSARS